jgi:eukaryotic-like serine/threonine-protein kinase
MSTIRPSITPDSWPAVSALLDEALALPEAEREPWLASLEGERAAFSDTLRELLSQVSQAAAVNTDDFLATLPRFTQSAARGPLAELAVGDTIGPYRLLAELGSGGMGAVWLAERADGALKRKVALKLPRMVWAKGLAERMARERDILATLEHPNIARLYDAGVDQHGRPYLALQYVEGQPIDVYCRERGLGVKDKLQLLLQVCSAVAYAHSRLVVHRDLKPSNILVTADGQVRLLDFGIAKLMEAAR